MTGLKIKGVPHEYDIISGVKENVISIMLNFKKLRFQFGDKLETTQWIAQRFKGVGIYTGTDLKLPSGVELLDPEEYLFEITDGTQEVNLEMRIEKGYGYYSLEYLRQRDKEQEASDTNMLLIDNDFGLVDYVRYQVEEVIEDFSGSVKDALIIELKAKSNLVNPQQIMMFAGEVLADRKSVV